MKNEDDNSGLKKIGLSLPADLVERLDQYADAEDRSRSNAVVVLLKDALAEVERRRAS